MKSTEEKLNKCMENSKKISEIQLQLNNCKENETKCNKQLKDGDTKCNEELSKKKREMNELKDKISNLENKIMNVEENRENKKDTYKSKGNKEDNYIISYDIFKSYLFKIYKIYKTFYIILVEKTYISNMKSKIADYKDLFIKFIKIYSLIIRGKLHTYNKLLLENNHMKNFMIILKNIQANQYIALLKKKATEIALTAKNILMNILIQTKPKLELYKSNINENIHIFLGKLQSNSEALLDHLYSINPDIKGIIPVKLSDQIILLIFFTIVNVIHLYVFFYFFFVIFKFIKKTIYLLLRWTIFIITFTLKIFFFFITLPIRPFMKKKKNKNRKAYKKHDENIYSNPERTAYQQNEFKRMNKNQHIKQRKY